MKVKRLITITYMDGATDTLVLADRIPSNFVGDNNVLNVQGRIMVIDQPLGDVSEERWYYFPLSNVRRYTTTTTTEETIEVLS